MRFLVDECTGPVLARWLKGRGHEVASVFDECRGINDDEVIEKAFLEDRILITNDKDFGEKAYREKRLHQGIILLRLADETNLMKIKVMAQILDQFSEALIGHFTVATEDKIRISKAF